MIAAPVIELLPNFHAGYHTGSCWFLASGLDGNILWIRISGHGPSVGDSIEYMGREIMSFPSMRCEVYARAGHVADPVEPEWELQEDLLGRCLFVGLNYPFLLDAPPIVGDHAGGPVLVFRSEERRVGKECRL